MAARKMTFTTVRDEEFIISEAQGRRSREQILLHSLAAKLQAGTVLGKVTRGAQAVAAPAAQAGNTGDGVFGVAPTADANIPAGNYRIEIDVEAANGGEFKVMGPDGVQVGPRGAVGVAYNGAINFTLNDGAADFDVGDAFTVEVTYAEGHGRYVPLNLAATDGSQIPAGFNCMTEYELEPVGHVRTAGFIRDGEVNGHKIFWPDGITEDQQATAEAQLADLQGLLVRY